MNNPVITKPGQDHPVLNDTVYKGVDFKTHAKLYQDLHKTVLKPSANYMKKYKKS
jgi:hypothetical protein